SNRTSSVRAPGIASSRPAGPCRASAAATATAARFASTSGSPGYSRSTAPSTTWRSSGFTSALSRSCPRCATPRLRPRSVPDDEQAAVVLRVDPPVRPDRERRVGGPDRELREHLVDDHTVEDLVEVAVLAVGVDDPVHVHRRRVDTPLEAEGMVGNARQRAVLVARAGL